MSLDEVMDLAGDLVEIAERALAPDAPLVPGEHCTFCRGAVVCPALHERALAVAASEFDDERPIEERRPRPPADLTPEQLALVLDAASLVKIWIAAVEAHARGLAEHGTRHPRLEAGRQALHPQMGQRGGGVRCTNIPSRGK